MSEASKDLKDLYLQIENKSQLLVNWLYSSKLLELQTWLIERSIEESETSKSDLGWYFFIPIWVLPLIFHNATDSDSVYSLSAGIL